MTRKTIPVTNPLRTLVDVAGILLPRELTDVVDNALARQLVTIAGLEAEIKRLSRPGRPGVGTLRYHLSDRGFVGAPAPSVLEAHLLRLIASSGLSLPSIEHRIGPDGHYRLDAAWVPIMFAVEVDGYVWHFSPDHKQRDETRRNHLRQLGWTLFVYSWSDVVKEPERVVREISEMYRRLSQPA